MSFLPFIAEAMRRSAGRLVLAVICCLPAHVCLAQARPSEYDVKAAFLVQFTSYVQWPEERSGVPLVFGVLGAEEIVDTLEQLETLPGGRPLQVRRMQRSDDPDGLHVLFVEETHSMDAEALMRDALDASVLIVTEASGPRPVSSIINFEIIDGKVRFDVSLPKADEAQLRFSARLLQVARRVIGAP